MRFFTSNRDYDSSPNPLEALHSLSSALFDRISSAFSSSPAASFLRAHVALPISARPASAALRPAKVLSFRKKSMKDLEDRLSGVSVYALCNAEEEFMLLSGAGLGSGSSVVFLCFRKEDAEALLEKVKCISPAPVQGSKVVPLALNKVFQLKVDGVSLRFVPDANQIAHAVKFKKQLGDSGDAFQGVPVFQSQSLLLMSQNRQFRPTFFRKEDLEESLYKAALQQNQLNPLLKRGDIQVATLEHILSEMKEFGSKWDDAVFVPPGFDISTLLRQQQKATTRT